MDVFSRCSICSRRVIAERESAKLAEKLIAASCVRRRIQPGQLTIDADRGRSMTSKLVALLMADLSVTKTPSGSHVSNENPFSESQFTPALAGGTTEALKYHPDSPERFRCQQDARSWVAEFFDWYNYCITTPWVY